MQVGKQEIEPLLINQKYFNKGQTTTPDIKIDEKDIRIEYGPF